jgi:hypothetical protein
MMLILSAALLSVASAAVPPVDLGTAGTFAILSKTGITNIPTAVVTGNVGVSPIVASSMTGWGLIADATNVFSKSDQISGKVFAANYEGDTPTMMETAVADMQIAYTNASARATTAAAYKDVKAGLVGGETFRAGVYTWGSFVSIAASTDVTIKGSDTDVFIFQMSGFLNWGANAKVILQDLAGNTCTDGVSTNNVGAAHLDGCPKASNIIWQVSTFVVAGADAHLEGIFLAKTSVALGARASLNGRILAQTAATLGSSTIITAPVILAV